MKLSFVIGAVRVVGALVHAPAHNPGDRDDGERCGKKRGEHRDHVAWCQPGSQQHAAEGGHEGGKQGTDPERDEAGDAAHTRHSCRALQRCETCEFVVKVHLSSDLCTPADVAARAGHGTPSGLATLFAEQGPLSHESFRLIAGHVSVRTRELPVG
jgi:hypothetical protein